MDQMGFQMPPSMGPPQITHQPPQFFGAYNTQDQSHLHQLPPDFVAHMFPDHLLMDEPEGSDSKKRRIARACDMCRKKKIKCDGKLPACGHCLNYKTECIFTHIEKKRAPPKGAKYIEGLENRLGRMENLLRLSGLLTEDEFDLGALEARLLEKSGQAPRHRASTSRSPTPQHELTSPMLETSSSPEDSLTSRDTDRDRDTETETELLRSKDGRAFKGKASGMEKDNEREHRHHSRDKDSRHNKPTAAAAAAAAARAGTPREEVEALAEMMCSLITNRSGESRYTGSQSGFSIFSPKGVQWINSKTGDDSFERMISHVSEDAHKWTNWKPQVFGHLFQRSIFRPLPPKEEALSLVEDYFTNFNCMLPLFYRPTFMHLLQRQYSADPYPGAGWWASLNVTLAIAHRIRVMSGLEPAEADETAWDYLKNAMACYSELTMRSTDLLSVQALLGMAFFLQATPNPQPVYMLIASALRLAHGIGLHKKGTGFDLNPIEIEQRKRVFWIAYMLDKDLCLRSGQPPVQDDEDMSVELPDFDKFDDSGFIPLAEGKGKMCLFKVLCDFTMIQSNVYKRMYSAKASRQSDGELLSTVGELDRQLEAWRDGIPIEFRPEHPIQASHTPLILHVVTLHFSYYNCLITIHRMSIQNGMWTSRLADYAAKGLNVRPLNPRIFSSAALCTSAARASIALLKYLPQGDFSCVWMILYYPVSALVTLFANILQNPLDPEARSDVKLMNLVVTFLSMLGHEAEEGGVHRMLGVCSEFCRVADSVIARAETDSHSRRKRKHPDHPASSSSSSSALRRGHTAAAAAPSLSPPQERPPEHLSPKPAWTSPYAPFGDSMAGSSSQTDSSPSIDSIGWAQHDHHVGPPSETDYLGGRPFGLGIEGATRGMHPEDAHSFGGAGLGLAAQPLVPQDLFSLQMSLDWGWAEMSGGAYPSVENGNYSFEFADQGMLHEAPQHHVH